MKFKHLRFVTDEWWHHFRDAVIAFCQEESDELTAVRETFDNDTRCHDIDLVWEDSSAPPTHESTLEDKVNEEIATYRAMVYKKQTPSHNDQLLFWSENRLLFACLSRFAAWVLSSQASEAEAERLFSRTGRVLIPSRAATSDQTLAFSVYIKMNTPELANCDLLDSFIEVVEDEEPEEQQQDDEGEIDIDPEMDDLDSTRDEDLLPQGLTEEVHSAGML